MKIIDQSAVILHIDGVDRIERAGRTCYKSIDKIGCDKEELEVCQGECGFCERHSSFGFVRRMIKSGHEAMLEHAGATVTFVTNRGVSHELVRHRVASFAQESTRFVNYGGKEMEFIRPVWCADSNVGFGTWYDNMVEAKLAYEALLNLGWQPEHAREVLPNSLATEIVVTANFREWRHILALRAVGTTGRPHPQMRALMLPLLTEFNSLLPCMFEDLALRAKG